MQRFDQTKGDTEVFDIVTGFLQANTLAPYLFITHLDNVLRTSLDQMKENGLTLKKASSRRYLVVALSAGAVEYTNCIYAEI